MSKLVIDTPEIRKEIASSHIVREKLKGLVAAIPIHVCRPGPPTEEESRITFKSHKTCSKLMHQDLSDGVLIYMPYVGTETAKNYFERTEPTVDNILYFFTNTIESIKRLASFDPFLTHFDLHAGNILALDNGESALCDFGMSISNDKRTGKIIDNIKEWWQKRSWNFENRITRQTICPLALLTIAKLGNPEIDYVGRLRDMKPYDLHMNLSMWNTYIHHIVLPRFKAMVEVGNPVLQKKAILAAIRFNDIHAICVLLIEYIERINPDIVMQAHGQLMAGAGGGYFSRSVDSMMSYIENTAKTNLVPWHCSHV